MASSVAALTAAEAHVASECGGTCSPPRDRLFAKGQAVGAAPGGAEGRGLAPPTQGQGQGSPLTCIGQRTPQADASQGSWTTGPLGCWVFFPGRPHRLEQSQARRERGVAVPPGRAQHGSFPAASAWSRP